MSRRSILVLLVGSAVLVGFAFAALAERDRGTREALRGNTAAPPQAADLDWSEVFQRNGARVVFGVKRFQVLANGWRARISVRNDSEVAFAIDRSRRSFGLMLFASGVHRDLENGIREQALPTLRPALTFEPDLPSTLDPNATWTGTMSAQGALVAGSFVRFVFGTLDAVGRAPDGFPAHLQWITDGVYRLKSSASG